MKPQYLDSILEALKPHLAPRHLVISIAAGVRIASLEANLPEARLEPAAHRVRASHWPHVTLAAAARAAHARASGAPLGRRADALGARRRARASCASCPTRRA